MKSGHPKSGVSIRLRSLVHAKALPDDDDLDRDHDLSVAISPIELHLVRELLLNKNRALFLHHCGVSRTTLMLLLQII